MCNLVLRKILYYREHLIVRRSVVRHIKLYAQNYRDKIVRIPRSERSWSQQYEYEMVPPTAFHTTENSAHWLRSHIFYYTAINIKRSIYHTLVYLNCNLRNAICFMDLYLCEGRGARSQYIVAPGHLSKEINQVYAAWIVERVRDGYGILLPGRSNYRSNVEGFSSMHFKHRYKI